MSVNELLGMFKEAEKTADYQLESALVDLAEGICEIMEEKGISRADLARQLGKSRGWVTKVLRGDRNLTLKTVIDILWELGYKASVNAEPRQGAADTWDQVDEYETQDVTGLNDGGAFLLPTVNFHEAVSQKRKSKKRAPSKTL